MRASLQRGFTLLEIVIVVLIIGFLLAGVLKSQELITSAKVKRVAGQLDEIRSAYFGFQDRFKALPGDYAGAAANLNCGTLTCLHGNGDARVRGNEPVVDGNQPQEELLLWSHLSTAGFLKGTYTMSDGESQASDSNAPKNPYAVYLQIAFDGNYGSGASGLARHNLKTGAQVPVSVLMELDRKIDDGKPYKGGLQFSSYRGNASTTPQEIGADACTTGTDADADWNFLGGSPNCGAALML